MKYVPDTNVGVYFLRNVLAAPLPPGDYFISAVTEIELLSKPGLSVAELARIRSYVGTMTVVQLPSDVRDEAARIRRDHGLKLPDAIIAATALVLGAELLSNDRQMARVPNLVVAALAVKP